ncbi:MAG: radical SAM protein [Bacteroidales bacterium]|jgi:radical SAM protein with 4Fe4S-binding SPASM domain|nr:radical SAM protein [Bacteroidales bacterium]
MEEFTKTAFQEKKQKWVNLYEEVPLDMPLSLNIELSGDCNYKCLFCSRSIAKYPIKRANHMSEETYLKIMRDLASSGEVQMLYLNGGGESLLNPDFSTLIRSFSLQKVSRQTLMSTNASLLNEKNSKALIESGLDYLRISISSIFQQTHEKLTQSKTHVNEIYENIRSFRAMRDKMNSKTPFLFIKMFDTFSEENELFKQRYGHLADKIEIDKLDNWNGESNFVKSAYNIREESIQEKANIDFGEREIRKTKICPHPFYKSQIRWNGDVSVCPADIITDNIMGNVHSESFHDIWNGKVFNRLRLEFLKGGHKSYTSCTNCRAYLLDISEGNLDSLTPSEYMSRLGKKK